MSKKRSYELRSDTEKLESQWRKLSGLHSREEWSAAIVRAATAAEIAANFAVRQEFAAQSSFESTFVDSMLWWANGLAGKLQKILVPATVGRKQKEMKALCKLAQDINTRRNAIVHQGEFCNEGEAKAAIATAKDFITRLVNLYEPAFVLRDHQSRP